jgi:hypothetical protein
MKKERIEELAKIERDFLKECRECRRAIADDADTLSEIAKAYQQQYPNRAGLYEHLIQLAYARYV